MGFPLRLATVKFFVIEFWHQFGFHVADHLIQRSDKTVEILFVQEYLVALVAKAILAARTFGNGDKIIAAFGFLYIQKIRAAFASPNAFGKYAFLLVAITVAAAAAAAAAETAAVTAAPVIAAAKAAPVTAETTPVTAAVVATAKAAAITTTPVIATAKATAIATETTPVTAPVVATAKATTITAPVIGPITAPVIGPVVGPITAPVITAPIVGPVISPIITAPIVAAAFIAWLPRIIVISPFKMPVFHLSECFVKKL